MRIGTPLTRSATRVMLLGCGELGKEIAIALQRFGVEVIGVDRYTDAPGHQVAHRAHVIDMRDADALLALIERERPQIVMPETEAIAADSLIQVAEDGLAEVIPTARAVQLTSNRESMRRLAAEELELPTSRYGFADSVDQLRMAIDGGVGYPCIVKPVVCSSGTGQFIVREPGEVDRAWRGVHGGSLDRGRAIVEELIDFDYEVIQMVVRAVGADGQVETHYCPPIGHLQERGDFIESWQPQAMSPAALKRARGVAEAVTARLGGRGLFAVELFVRGDRVWFSAVSPRPRDPGLVTLCSQVQNEFELHARAVLGLPVDIALREAGACAVIYGGVVGPGIVFEGVDEALRVPGSDLRLFGKPEAFVHRRMGVALATAAQSGEARQRAKQCAGRVRPLPAD